MTTPLHDCIAQLLDHLSISRTHIAGRLAPDWLGFVTNHSEKLASLTIVAPPVVPAAALTEVQSRTLVFTSDLEGGMVATAAMATIPQAEHRFFKDYETLLWADLTVDQADMIGAGLVEQRDKVSRNDSFPSVASIDAADHESEGEVAGITYRMLGQGEPLLLFPLALSPSAWEPMLEWLSQRFCVIVLGGPSLGALPVLETRGQTEGYLSMMERLFKWVDLQSGESVVEVGCGTGVVLRWLATETEGRNPLTGMDLNNYLLGEARGLVQKDGLSNIITFDNGNAEEMPYADNTFDVAYSTTVMEEVNAARMMAELVRIVKPGGRVGVIVRATDMPFRINVPLTDEERTPFELPQNRPEGDSCASASLYRYFQESPLEDEQFSPLLAAFHNAYGVVERFMLGGFLSQLEATTRDQWDSTLRSAHENGTFSLAWPHHLAVGRKPQP